MNLSFKNTFFTLSTVTLSVFILFEAREILIPLAFALLLGFILYPMVKWMTSKGIGNSISITLSIFTLVGSIVGTIYFFSRQAIKISQDYTSFLEKLRSILNSALKYLNNKVTVLPDIKPNMLINKIGAAFSESGFVIVSDTLGVTSSVVSDIVLALIYTFLLLLYRRHLVNAAASFQRKENKEKFKSMIKDAQTIGQQYLVGMVLLILILGTLNSIGLFIIGIDYAFFFGFLAAVLAIIPYVGTAIGAFLPTVYALVTYDSPWYAVAVIGLFWFVQTLEGNFLSPKIVGGKLELNALFSILSLIAGGLLWGISGMILFLPLLAIFKVICGYYEELNPVAELLGSSEDSSSGSFMSKLKSLF